MKVLRLSPTKKQISFDFKNLSFYIDKNNNYLQKNEFEQKKACHMKIKSENFKNFFSDVCKENITEDNFKKRKKNSLDYNKKPKKLKVKEIVSLTSRNSKYSQNSNLIKIFEDLKLNKKLNNNVFKKKKNAGNVDFYKEKDFNFMSYFQELNKNESEKLLLNKNKSVDNFNNNKIIKGNKRKILTPRQPNFSYKKLLNRFYTDRENSNEVNDKEGNEEFIKKAKFKFLEKSKFSSKMLFNLEKNEKLYNGIDNCLNYKEKIFRDKLISKESIIDLKRNSIFYKKVEDSNFHEKVIL